MTRKRIASVLKAAPLLALIACSSTWPRQEPVGQIFPAVAGESLDGTSYRLPDDLVGAPTLLLVGYEQDTQFDLDRWLLGLHQAQVKVRVFEVPTIPGLVPGLVASRIDEGMRSGIPQGDWASVITVYKDAERIARFTGNENRLPGRILLLDAEGRVAFFHDAGYSVSALVRLQEALASLGGA